MNCTRFKIKLSSQQQQMGEHKYEINSIIRVQQLDKKCIKNLMQDGKNNNERILSV
jgi:hypothetical protein